MTDPMPVFTIKAQDELAPRALLAYAGLCMAAGLDHQAQQVRYALYEIEAWQAANPDRVKLPDHPHVPATAGPGQGSYADGWRARDRAMVIGRCWSCDHESALHQPDGCWYTVTNGTVGKDLVCVCSEPAPASVQREVSE